jgi:hypothetical protein
VKGRPADGTVSFSLPLEHSADGDNAPSFKPNDVYLEVTVNQIWLSNEREYWQEFQPFLAVVTDFIHTGERCSLPALLGSSQLDKSQGLIKDGDAIEFRDIRVAGPIPYEGDKVNLLITLFRVETGNWLMRTLDAVEAIATAVSAGGAWPAKPVAETIVSAVTRFRGEEKLELRCGQYRGWSRAVDPSKPRVGDLRPMHYVLMNRPLPREEEEEKVASKFKVRNGVLCVDEGETAKPYTDHDFVLLSIEATELRDDYKSLPFYGLWLKTKDHLENGDLVPAERSWRKTLGAIYDDRLTKPQQQSLAFEYKGYYDEYLTLGIGSPVRGKADKALESGFVGVEEREPLEIVSSPLP